MEDIDMQYDLAMAELAGNVFAAAGKPGHVFAFRQKQSGEVDWVGTIIAETESTIRLESQAKATSI